MVVWGGSGGSVLAALGAMEPVIRSHGLTKHYGRTRALESLDLEVPAGVVFGCLGPNGAGKTTWIRLLVGLLRPTRGRVDVLGTDVSQQPNAVQARIGYLPGEFVADDDLSAEQYLRFLCRVRGEPDPSAFRRLAERLDLDLGKRFGSLSHGNRQKVGIIQALMHEPDLLILDEPTSGLDPLVQREFLQLLREVRADGRTVVLSSHVVAEVEAVADVVGILREGRLVVAERVETLKTGTERRIELRFAEPPPADSLDGVAGVRDVRIDGHAAQLVVEGSTAALLEALSQHQVEDIVTHEPSLDDAFLHHYRAQEA